MTLKYGLALGLIAALACLNFLLASKQIAVQRARFRFVSLATDQRELVLEIAVLSESLLEADSTPAREAIRHQLHRAVQELDGSRQGLLHPLAQPALTPVATEAGAVYLESVAALEDRVHAVSEQTLALLRVPVAELGPDNPQVKSLKALVRPSNLMEMLNQVVARYKRQSDQNLAKLKELEAWDLGAMLTVLVGTGLLVFRPMQRRIRYEVDKLRDAEAYSRAVVQTAADGILTLDESGLIESVNAAAEEIFGVTSALFIGRRVADFLPWPPAATKASEPVVISEGAGRRANGAAFPVDMAVSETRLGQRRVYIVVVRDITERKRLENAKLQAERLAVIGSMSAKVAHEIRNPLGSITLNLDLARKEIEALGQTSRHPPAEGRTLVDSIRTEVKRIQHVIDAYLQFARLPKPQRRLLNVSELLATKLAFMSAAFEPAKVAVQREFDAQPVGVNADEEQLWQAILNLIRNGLEAMPGGGRLTLKVHRHASQAVIVVTDSGPGMADEQMRQLFRPFFSTKPTGTGLGLALAQQIIAEHGGHIECTSAPGQGSTFTVSLPLAPAE